MDEVVLKVRMPDPRSQASPARRQCNFSARFVSIFCLLACVSVPAFAGRVIHMDVDALIRKADGLAMATITNIKEERTPCSRTTIIGLTTTRTIKGNIRPGMTYDFTYTTFVNKSEKKANPNKCRRVHYYLPPRASRTKKGDEVMVIIKNGVVTGTKDP